MPPAKRRRRAAAPTIPSGPNHQLNILREQLDAQVKAEETIQTTQDANIQAALEQNVADRTTDIASTLDEFLHDPFSRLPTTDFSHKEKRALKRLRAAIISTQDEPSDANKSELVRANRALVFLMRPEARTAASGTKLWVPKKYRSEAPINPITNLPKDHNQFPAEERALQWRPVHLRKDINQSLYYAEDKDNDITKDPLDQETFDLLRPPKLRSWHSEDSDSSSDDKISNSKKKRTAGKNNNTHLKKRKTEQDQTKLEDDLAGENKMGIDDMQTGQDDSRETGTDGMEIKEEDLDEGQPIKFEQGDMNDGESTQRETQTDNLDSEEIQSTDDMMTVEQEDMSSEEVLQRETRTDQSALGDNEPDDHEMQTGQDDSDEYQPYYDEMQVEQDSVSEQRSGEGETQTAQDNGDQHQGSRRGYYSDASDGDDGDDELLFLNC